MPLFAKISFESVSTRMGPGLPVNLSKATEREVFPETGAEMGSASSGDQSDADPAKNTESLPA